MSVSKPKRRHDSWFYSHLGHHSARGNLQAPCEASPPGICLLSTPSNQFSLLYRDCTMTEFEFFANREERWGDSMRALWGNLSVFPLLDHIDLPYHTARELLSISCLKVWGDTQKPWNGMAYLMVKVEDASEVKGYGMAILWISPHQARASMMEEALEILSTCVSGGLDWLYVLTQLYEGTNHVPLPKDKHLGILPQGKVESPCGQISQLKVHQLLSARLQVVYPMGLNGGNQSVTIDLPGPLHSGSSVTTDEHPYIKIDIPSPTPKEQDGVNPPLGGGHATQAVATLKTPWKPRVTLTAEVGELLNRGMTEDYDCEPEHSAMVKELATKADTSPPPRQRCQPCHWTHPLKPVFQIWRPPWKAIQSPILPQQWPIVAAVTVLQWTFQSFRLTPT